MNEFFWDDADKLSFYVFDFNQNGQEPRNLCEKL